MKKYKNSQYPDKANDFVDNEGNLLGATASKAKPLTEAPTADNPEDNIRVVLLNSKPEVRYKGYLYLINLTNYTITKVVSHGTIDAPEKIRQTEDIDVYLTANEGCVLPDNISVTGVGSSYDAKTGVIHLSNPIDNVIITATCLPFYSITVNVTNGTVSGATTIVDTKTATLSLIPNEDYMTPESITVTGATYQYIKNSKLSGTINLSNPTENVIITIVCPEYATIKGDIINLDLTDSGETAQYRVLKINGTIAEVMAMTDASTSQKYNAFPVKDTFADGTTGQKYAGSDLDTFLNETWYATLSETAKAAIVDKELTQDMWGQSDYGGDKYSNYTSWGSSETLGVKPGATLDIGSRHVYALSIHDIIDYLGLSSGDTITREMIWNLFWNRNTNLSRYVWLSSAYLSSGVCGVDGYYGCVSYHSCSYDLRVRPAFSLDLSKIDWNYFNDK